MTLDSCIVCGGVYIASHHPGLLECQDCRFTTADLCLSHGELVELYSEKYFAGDEYRDYLAERDIIEKHFRVRLSRLLRYVQQPDGKELLEIGCAYGFFLNIARTVFRSVQGIDISSDATKYARDTLGLSVYTEDFLLCDEIKHIDVLCLWDTIEHLQSPHLYLEKASDLMDAGGSVAITTGDINSVMARFRGAKWRQIHPPTHLHYFSKETLGKILRRYGFRVQYCKYEGMYRSLDMIAYIILTIKNNHPDMYKTLKRTGILEHSIYLNLYDIVFCIATRE